MDNLKVQEIFILITKLINVHAILNHEILDKK